MAVLGSGTRTARKWHRCDLCTGLVAPGETYFWWTYTDARQLHDGKAHWECQQCWWWIASEFGLGADDPLDPNEFRNEHLPAYRQHRAEEGVTS